MYDRAVPSPDDDAGGSPVSGGNLRGFFDLGMWYASSNAIRVLRLVYLSNDGGEKAKAGARSHVLYSFPHLP